MLVALLAFTTFTIFTTARGVTGEDTYVAPGMSFHLHTDEGETFENVVVDGNDLTGNASETTCEEVHDSFVAQGPDDNWYPTWHPWRVGECVFGHDHGNDPSSVVDGFQPLYGYVNNVHGMEESHHGFKTYALTDTDGLHWIVTMHQGTTTDNALCAQFHAIEVAVFDGTTMKARLSTMGDFGFSRLGDTSTRLSPPKCDGSDVPVVDLFPNNANINSQGLRRIPTTNTSGGDGYTPYIVNQTVAELGLRMRASFLTTNGRTHCLDAECDTLQTNTANAGDRRRFQTLGSESFNINQSVTTTNNGWFTDSMGVEQYLESGFNDKLELCRSERLGQYTGPNGANGCWYKDPDRVSQTVDGPLEAQDFPARAAVDTNGFNGSRLISDSTPHPDATVFLANFTQN